MPLRPFALCIEETDVLYFLDNAYKVSPFLIVWRNGALLFGFVLTVDGGFDAAWLLRVTFERLGGVVAPLTGALRRDL